MRQVGYTKHTAVVPGNLTKSKGWNELCEQAGLTDQLLLGSLVSDIKKKPRRRKAELELGFKVKGYLRDNQSNNNVVVIVLPTEVAGKHDLINESTISSSTE